MIDEDISNLIKSQFADGLIRKRLETETSAADFNTVYDEVASRTFDWMVRFDLKRFTRKSIEVSDTENEVYKNLKGYFIEELRKGSFSGAESAIEEAVQMIIEK